MSEGIDYLSKESEKVFKTDGVRADNQIVNMITNRFNKELEEKNMSNDYYVVGEDLISALKHDPILFPNGDGEKEVKDDYISEIKHRKYFFVYDSNYPLQHTVLFVIDKINKTVDYYNTLYWQEAPDVRKGFEKDCKLLKKFYGITQYPITNRSSEVVKQTDNVSCAFYCSIFIDKFIKKGQYKLDNSFKNISQKDIHDFKMEMLKKIKCDVFKIPCRKEHIGHIKLIKAHKPHFILTRSMPNELNKIYLRNEKLQKKIKDNPKLNKFDISTSTSDQD